MLALNGYTAAEVAGASKLSGQGAQALMRQYALATPGCTWHHIHAHPFAGTGAHVPRPSVRRLWPGRCCRWRVPLAVAMPYVHGQPAAAAGREIKLFGSFTVQRARHPDKSPNRPQASCPECCWEFGWAGPIELQTEVLSDPGYNKLPRDVDVVEIWSGVQTIVNAAKACQLNALPFDIARVPGESEHTEDITSLCPTFAVQPCQCFRELACWAYVPG